MPAAQYTTLTTLLRNKKNIILQGAPGVGKTYTARRLAWAMMGEKDDSRIEFIQFHQSYSYEDFIMGYRPKEGSGFTLHEGVFYRFCNIARSDPNREYFFIIDEINRGNPNCPLAAGAFYGKGVLVFVLLLFCFIML